MFRRRTSLSLSAAAAVLVAAPLLTACGGEAHAGAAAVVGGERITMSQVQSKVEAVRAAQRDHEQADVLIKETGQLTRSTLSGLVLRRVLERAAGDAGVTVSRAEIQEARELAARQVGGPERLESLMLRQQAATPDEIDEMLRVQLLVQGLAEKLGANLQTPQGQEELRAELEKASRELDVSVNPRYGKWDDEQVSLAEADRPWIRELTNPGPEQPA
ncbi:SurA N-terminal domain-containing protein [Streptomyces sp. TRM 70361]|uniref:SurA N-terminal domain-containing protein n=1 Tax=Streptomyces sp. TRM 70361 TaxID=3116553 RepID=UPI002E7B4311|nr:SurA N-terminal domain-containing protein [Streptomyces sp. TRM 70361]MEE1938533.1 SurA N-terminal domain-containing protein [Streptomyces sp. TRM 70361]